MAISFLRYLSGLNGPRTQQVTAKSGDRQALTAKTVITQLLAHMPEALFAAVLDVQSGSPLASYAAERRYQAAAITGSVAEAIRRLQAGLATQPATATDQLREVLLTSSTHLHLSCLGTQGQLLYLLVEAHDTNLALARQLAQQAILLFDSIN